MLIDISLMLHLKFAHMGRDKVLHLLIDLIWHPLKYRVVDEITTCCPQCQFLKISTTPVSPPIIKICTSYPFELLAIDLVSLPRTNRGNIGCVTVVDHFSKWVQAIPIKNKTSAHISGIVKDIIFPSLPKVPSSILSDNGSEFRGKEFTNMIAKLGVKQRFVTPLTPSSNGAIERVNRTIINFLRGLTQQGEDWDLHLSQAVISYNNSYHTQIKMSPSSCLLTKSHISCTPQLDIAKLTDRWAVGHKNFAPYKLNQFVLQKISVKNHLNVNKLAVKYKGPYEVVRVNSNNVTYLLKDPSKSTLIRAHHRDLILFKDPPLYLRNHPWFHDVMSKFMQQYGDNYNCPDSNMYNSNNVELLQACSVSSGASDDEASATSEGSSTSGVPSDGDDDFSSENSVMALHQLGRGGSSERAVRKICNQCDLEEWLDLRVLNFDSPADVNSELPGEVGGNVINSTFIIDNHVLGLSDPQSRELSVSAVATDHYDDSNLSDNSIEDDIEYIDSIYNSLFGSDEANSQEVDSSSVQLRVPQCSSTPVEQYTHATRSRGPVRDLPHVQPIILERGVPNKR